MPPGDSGDLKVSGNTARRLARISVLKSARPRGMSGRTATKVRAGHANRRRLPSYHRVFEDFGPMTRQLNCSTQRHSGHRPHGRLATETWDGDAKNVSRKIPLRISRAGLPGPHLSERAAEPRRAVAWGHHGVPRVERPSDGPVLRPHRSLAERHRRSDKQSRLIAPPPRRPRVLQHSIQPDSSSEILSLCRARSGLGGQLVKPDFDIRRSTSEAYSNGFGLPPTPARSRQAGTALNRDDPKTRRSGCSNPAAGVD